MTQATTEQSPHEAALVAQRQRVGCWIHDTVLQTLEYIAGLGAELHTPQELGQIAARAADDLRRGLEAVASGASADLAEELRDVVHEARRATTGEVELQLGEIRCELQPELVQDLAGAVREALNNARKHADASSVLVRCESRSAETVVSVQDDGRGFVCEASDTGFGLRNSIFRRIERHGGSVELVTRPGSGTSITMHVAALDESVGR